MICRYLMIALLGFGPGVTALWAAAEPEEIVVWNRVEAGHAFRFRVLEMSLDATLADYGEYRVSVNPRYEANEIPAVLNRGDSIDVAIFAPNRERERTLLPVRIPVTQGLLGHRVCMIRKGTAERFAGIRSVKDWQERQLVIGQGTDWSDTAILNSNGLEVVTSNDYFALFDMLEQEKYDCFSRSVNEIDVELMFYNTGELLEVEQSLLLVYPLPMFFFVGQGNRELHRRITTGFRRILADGSYQKAFQLEYHDTLKSLNLESREVLYLKNPFLSEATQALFENKSYYLIQRREQSVSQQ